MMKYAEFPFQIPEHWDLITSTLNSVVTWTPDIFVQTIHKILQSSIRSDKPFKAPPEQMFSKLQEIFKNNTEYEGDVTKPWGGEIFDGSSETFPRITWWFMKNTLPFLSHLLLDMPDSFKEKVKLCTRETKSDVKLTKRQCATLLSMSFFCANHINCTLAPFDNFQNLVNFQHMLMHPAYTNRAKLYMLMNYFERCRVLIKDEVFEIKRLLLKPTSLKFWAGCDAPLSVFHTYDTGGITETAGGGLLHVDFANEYIGGGVLGGGAVQEEIMFSVCPELLVSLMFCSKMDNDEAILLVNAEQFSVAKGYNSSLKYGGDFVDTTHTSRIAIDAIPYGWGRQTDDQFRHTAILRDLNKARVGFDNEYPTKNSGIATGNWGCGAFGGNIQLKSMLQWCAASSVFRDVHYYTFKDKNAVGLEDITKFLFEKDLTVAKLMQSVLDYADLRCKKTAKESLFDFLKKRFSD